MSGIAMPIMTGITGTVAGMKGTIGDWMQIITATGVTREQAEGIGIGKEIN
jgi:hypothetical protein